MKILSQRFDEYCVHGLHETDVSWEVHDGYRRCWGFRLTSDPEQTQMRLCQLLSAYFMCTVCLHNKVQGISEDGFVVLRVIKGADLPTVLGPHSSVGIVTCYGLDGTGTEYWRGEIFPYRPDWPWNPPSFLYVGPCSFPGVKRPGNGPDHPLPCSAEVKERVELYIYSPSGPSWAVLEWNFTYLLSEVRRLEIFLIDRPVNV